MSDSTIAPDGGFLWAPERVRLVAAVAAVLDDDPVAAALALQSALDASSWDDVERRLAVAERALRVDASTEPWCGPAPATVDDDTDRWSALWHGLHAVARLAERAGYPPDLIA